MSKWFLIGFLLGLLVLNLMGCVSLKWYNKELEYTQKWRHTMDNRMLDVELEQIKQVLKDLIEGEGPLSIEQHKGD